MYRKNNDIICIRETHRPAMVMLSVSEDLLDNWLELPSAKSGERDIKNNVELNLPLP